MAHLDATRARLRGLIREIRARHVVPWTLAYLAGAWVLLEATGYLADLYGWPDALSRVLPIVLGAGAISAMVIAWFHGAAGWQRVTVREALIHAGIAGLLVVSLGLWYAPRSVSGSDSAEPPLTRLAVLYFKSHSTVAEDGALAERLTEEVVHRLTTVPALDVLSLNVSRPYRESPAPAGAELAQSLRVGAYVEGSLGRVGDSVRVVAHLVDARADSHLGSWVVSCPAADARCAAPGLADVVTDSIRVRIGEELRRRRVEAQATVPAALERYRRAVSLAREQASVEWREDRRAGLALLEEADRLLDEAERLDPTWAAPAELRMEVAEVASQLEGGAGYRELGRLREAVEHADRALSLVEDSAPILEQRGHLKITLASHSDRAEAERLFEEAEGDLRMAAALDPRRPKAWWALSELSNRKGLFESAYEHAARAHEQDSFGELGPDAVFQLLLLALQLERLDEADRWCEDGRRKYPGDQMVLQGCLMRIASLSGPSDEDIEQAWMLTAAFARAGVGMAENRDAWVAWGQAITAATIASRGDADSVDAVLGRALPVLRETSPRMHASGLYFEALARHRLARPDSALRLLAAYVDLVPAEAPGLDGDWWFRGLWTDPRYQALYRIDTESAPGR